MGRIMTKFLSVFIHQTHDFLSNFYRYESLQTSCVIIPIKLLTKCKQKSQNYK